MPRMLQSHFAVDGNLFVFDRKRAEKGVWRTGPGNLLVASHLYTETAYDGEKDSSMEKELSILEGNAAPVIEAIVETARAGRAPKLTFHEKGSWDRFFIQQWSRVEPPRLCRRPFILSYAAMAGASSMA
ncbi:DUF4238 domain-containing protein [Rhizobium sp. YIM 134829]|uniref:DUF4238 domain-containing protein n=1 Tax=Rhizobium sp. YIM 134829 TaxID=3390453 RepID=UPI003979E7E5